MWNLGSLSCQSASERHNHSGTELGLLFISQSQLHKAVTIYVSQSGHCTNIKHHHISTKATQHVLHHEFAQRWHPRQARPLTAYHIFLQIEREYIIQTSEGEIADKSSLDNKIYLNDVPNCYKNICLLRDQYAGPGKRKKRKHRKQLEVSLRVLTMFPSQITQIICLYN